MRWTIDDARRLYGVDRWGKGVFDVNAGGEIVVRAGESEASVLGIVRELIRTHDLWPPVLIRFSDILAERMRRIREAFEDARRETGFRGRFVGVYPIKVNQQAQVVEEVAAFGRAHGWGIEAGSKPELHAALAMMEDVAGPIVCNGYKDAEFVYLALWGEKLGREVYLVVEKPHELDLILEMAERVGVKPRIGVRCRLAATGEGRWRDSGGDASKFGLSAAEVLALVERLKARDRLDCLNLLHFHLGSQIPRIGFIRRAIQEAGRFYVELRRAGAAVSIVDVGGGLGVDYDGTFSGSHSSVDYTIGEYAGTVLWELGSIAGEAGLPHPDVIAESGRALVAHHAVLVVNVLGASRAAPPGRIHRPRKDAPLPLRQLWDVWDSIGELAPREALHDALGYREDMLRLFVLGHARLADRALAERLFWRIIEDIEARAGAELAGELAPLADALVDKYFCNFSVFQSLPDAWAIGQVFPVAPLHRLDERPARRGVLVDVTCDSDGRLARFPAREGDPAPGSLPLHEPRGDEDYFLGVFLVGAYQEILGDLHNLFGDTHAVHVRIEDGRAHIEQVVEGESVAEVLDYVQFHERVLLDRMRRETARARAAGRITAKEAAAFLRFFREGLAGYTYLEENLPPSAHPRD